MQKRVASLLDAFHSRHCAANTHHCCLPLDARTSLLLAR
jgi:hypothetical protein